MAYIFLTENLKLDYFSGKKPDYDYVSLQFKRLLP